MHTKGQELEEWQVSLNIPRLSLVRKTDSTAPKVMWGGNYQTNTAMF